MSDKNDSPAFSLNVADVIDITKNTALVALAAGLTYLGENLGDLDLEIWVLCLYQLQQLSLIL